MRGCIGSEKAYIEDHNPVKKSTSWKTRKAKGEGGGRGEEKAEVVSNRALQPIDQQIVKPSRQLPPHKRRKARRPNRLKAKLTS
jgi:hypothetical protein